MEQTNYICTHRLRSTVGIEIVPVVSRVIGVIIAATPHPNLLKIILPPNIISNVTIPVAVEKFPMKEE